MQVTKGFSQLEGWCSEPEGKTRSCARLRVVLLCVSQASTAIARGHHWAGLELQLEMSMLSCSACWAPSAVSGCVPPNNETFSLRAVRRFALKKCEVNNSPRHTGAEFLVDYRLCGLGADGDVPDSGIRTTAIY